MLGALVAATYRRQARHPRLRRETMTVGGLRMHARRSACTRGGVPVVLVHGWGVSGSYLVPLAAELARTVDVCVPDLPGHGRSATPPRAPDVEGLAEWLRAWLDTAGIAECVLAGNSLGAQIAAAFAERWPERVTHLVLMGPTLDATHRSLPARALRLASDVPLERPSLIALVLVDYLRMHLRLLPELRAMFADRLETRAPRLAMPVLCLRGAHDTVASRRWLRSLVARFPRGRMLELPLGAHAVHHSHPAFVAAAIRELLGAEECTAQGVRVTS